MHPFRLKLVEMSPLCRRGSQGLGGLCGVLYLLVLLALSARAENSSDGLLSPAAGAMRVLHSNCLSCHNPEKEKGGLDLTTREGLLRGGDSGVVIASDPDQSRLIEVLAADAEPHMPPKKQLRKSHIELLREWVSEGAPWDDKALAQAAERQEHEVQWRGLPATYRPVLALALSPDGKRLAIARANKIVVHDLNATNQPVQAEVEAHRDSVRALAWSPDSTLLASGGYREVKLWGEGLSERWGRTNFLERVTAVQFSPFGGALIVAEGMAGESGWVRLLDVEEGEVITEWEAHGDSIYDLAVSGEGGLLATAGHDGVVKLWELISKREVGQLEGHSGAIYGAAFNTNASELVTASADHELRVWDVKSRQSVVTVGPKKHGFNAVRWSADGEWVLAGTDDGRLIRFNDFKRHTGAQSSDTGKERQVADWDEPVLALAVDVDASRIFAGTQDGTVRMLDREGKELAKFEPAKPETIPSPEVPSFVRDVLPVMAKAGCMAGSCHAKPAGQNGFKLSVFSFDPTADFEEIVKEARGRRVFPAAPEESLLLLKPTLAIAHEGGQRFEPESEAYQVIENWIAGGMVYRHENEPTLARITVEPKEGSYQQGGTVQLHVQAHYSDGATRDVTELAEYDSTRKEMAAVDEHGRVQIGQLSGQGVIVTRFMGLVDAAHITVPAQTRLDKSYADLPVHNYIDRLAHDHFERLGLFPSEECTDAVFIRRSSLDTVGVLPTPSEVRTFLADPDKGKRRRWIERLLEHPLYADYWANKWADLLRPNPDRVGVKSIYTLDQWLRGAFRENMPYDEFVREILLAEGSNHRFGPAVVYRDRREPPELTTMFSQLFLGVRMECAKCHHHPNEKWSQHDFYEFAAFFGPVKQKGAGLSPPISAGMETFYFQPGGKVKHPVTDEEMQPRPLDAPEAVKVEGDPRTALVQWLTEPENPYFARAAVNRVWAVFFGRGFVEPVDDFRISNPASNEALLDALAKDFAEHGYDLKHLIRTILNSRLYQLSSTPNEYNVADTEDFSRSYRRRLAAEVLLDAIDDITGVRDTYNGSPPGTRAVQTWSYKVRSHFMDSFGRPDSSSDCPCERDLRTSVVQSLHMMNSRELQKKLSSDEGRIKELAESKMTAREIVTELYLSALSRYPTSEELALACEPFEASGVSRRQAAEDVLWALLNSAEFVFNH